jgi:hypothetical protein
VSVAEPMPSEQVGSDPDDELLAALRPIVRVLEIRLPSIARPDIERVVLEEYLRFHHARVRQYVPIFVERSAQRRLRPLSPVPGTEGGA